MIWMRPRKFEVLDLNNRDGSVEHYFHFFFGALIPLANYLSTNRRKNFYFVRSCGPMNRHLLDLNWIDLVIVNKAFIPPLRGVFGSTILEGFDAPEYYDQSVFLRSRDFLLNNLDDGRPAAERNDLTPGRIVLVNRGDGDPYYSSRRTEIKTSGKKRRSIPNIEEIGDAIRRAGENADVFEMESMRLEEQSRVFGSAKVVVAQHGAALANIFWMKPGTKVVEITPVHDRVYYGRLSEIFGVRHEIVHQDSRHAPVDVEAVVAAIMR